MNTKFYQACFTRVDAGNLSAGWQVINTSADIMQSMVAFFENNEKANDVSVNKQNADGSPLKVTKIICDAKNIGLTQIQYGLSDNSGRARFFSHGYITSDPYEVLKHPENILGISDDNFHFSLEDTRNVPDELSYAQPYNEKDIMDKYGLNRDLCNKFIKCALFPLFSSTQTTVFIQTDGTREMAMDLLYIIYHSLPYSLRPRVTASTYAKPVGVNSMYVFTDNVPSVGNHINPLSGDNNIIVDAYEKRLERFPFALYYVEHIPQTIEAHDKYYTAFENVLKDMGDSHMNKMESLRLAFMTLGGVKISNDEVGGLLFDWLSLPVSINDNVVNRIVKFVHLAVENNIALSDNVIKLLRERINESNSKILYNEYVSYEACAIVKSGAEAYKKLDELRQDKNIFPDVCEELRKSFGGKTLLSKYYLLCARRLIEQRICSYNDMVNFTAECYYIDDIQKVREIFCEKCRHILWAEQRKGKNYKLIYSAYINAIKSIDPAAGISLKEFTDDYDCSFRANFDVNRISEYEEFYKHFTTYIWSSDFLKVWNAVSNKKFHSATEYVQNKCCLGNYSLSPDDEQSFARNILDHALENDACEYCKDMHFWCAFADILNYDLIEFMARKRVRVLCDPDALYAAMETDDYWWNLDNLEVFFEGCKRYCDDNKDQQAITKYTLRLLKDQVAEVKKAIKADEKKNRDKEQTDTSNPIINIIHDIQNFGKRFQKDEYDDEQDVYSDYEEVSDKSRKDKQSKHKH